MDLCRPASPSSNPNWRPPSSPRVSSAPVERWIRPRASVKAKVARAFRVGKVSPATPRKREKERETPKSSRAALRHTRFSGFRESRVQGETATETSSAPSPRLASQPRRVALEGTPGTAPASHKPRWPEPRGAHLAGAPAATRVANPQLN